MKPHKHEKLIKAWAEGAEIEYYSPFFQEWSNSVEPSWQEHHEYRLKSKFKVGDQVIIIGQRREIKSVGWEKGLIYTFTTGTKGRECDVELAPEEELHYQIVPFTFEDAEFLVGKVVRYKQAELLFLITAVTGKVYVNSTPISFAELFRDYTFLDYTMCGKIINKNKD